LVIKALKRPYLFGMAQSSFLHCGLKHPDRFVIDTQGNGKRVAILTSMSE